MLSCVRTALAVLCIVSAVPSAVHAQFNFGDAAAESQDGFGRVVARGDFNGDGYQDLAVGVPFEDVTIELTTIRNAGAVAVIYGAASGLQSAGRQFWRQGSSGVADAAETDDFFGSSLAAGDFNGDGYDDLAVGVPSEDVSGIANTGAVHVVHGSAAGLSAVTVPDQFWHQSSPGLSHGIERDARFGSSLTAADFDGDGYDDLAVGVPGEDLTGCGFFGCDDPIVDAGAVQAIYGSTSGLKSRWHQFWNQFSSETDYPEERDHFGSALAAGDFNRDGYADLAVAAAGEGIGSAVFAGALSVIYGGATGLSTTATPNQFWHQDSASVEDVAEDNDFFGCSLATGDFDGDGHEDLAVGVCGEDLHPIARGSDAGAVHVIYGSPSGLNAFTVPADFWHQSTPDVQDRIESGDQFGDSLTTGDFNGDGFADLAIGIRGEDVDTLVIGTVSNAGAVTVLYGSGLGLSATVIPDQFWHQTRSAVEDSAEEGDSFGAALGAGDFNGDGIDDLAIGVPFEDLSASSGTIVDAGGVNVIYGSSTELNATTIPNQLWTQIFLAILPPMP